MRSFSGSVSKTWNSLNPATLSGAIDVVVVEQEDGKQEEWKADQYHVVESIQARSHAPHFMFALASSPCLDRQRRR